MDELENSKNGILRWFIKRAPRPEPGREVELADKRRDALDTLFSHIPEPETWIPDPADRPAAYMLAAENRFVRITADLTLDVTEDSPPIMRVDARKLDPSRHTAAFEIRRLGDVNEHCWTFDLGLDERVEIATQAPGHYEQRIRIETFARTVAARLGCFDTPAT